MKNLLIKTYKDVKNLEVKNKLLKLLNNGRIVLNFSDVDFQVEKILEKIYYNQNGSKKLLMRYGRNYNTTHFELI